MNKKIVKRNGSLVDFDISKIKKAIAGAVNAVPNAYLDEEEIEEIAEKVQEHVMSTDQDVSVEEIFDETERQLMSHGHYEVAKTFIVYRQKRATERHKTLKKVVSEIINRSNEEANEENSNKDAMLNPTAKEYIAEAVLKDMADDMYPEAIMEAHRNGIIHNHDLAEKAMGTFYNCCLVNIEDMLQNGTVISNTKITKPKSFAVACNVTTQIIAQVASSQYGGQTISLAHLIPFVDTSRKNLYSETKKDWTEIGISFTEEQLTEFVRRKLMKEIKAGVKTIQYQIVTLMTTNGQTPFVSIYMDINEVPEGQAREDMVLVMKEVFRQRLKGLPNRTGAWVTPGFPKLLYVLDENNMEGGKYQEVSWLAAQCAAKRMTPDFISAKKMRELKQGDVYSCMGCRSFLTVDRVSEKLGNIANAGNYKEGEHKYYGRFNQGVVTINLVDVACSSYGNFDKFWEILEDRLENLCHKALRVTHDRLKNTISDVAPILWQDGAIARLEKGEKITKLLYDGYSTISLGYAGLYECVKYMTGKSHTEEGAKDFAISVMQYLNDKCTEWKAEENIDYSLYGTPMENATYRFAKALQGRFGIIKGVTDKNYITNSYHIPVTQKINAFDKLTIEAQFQELSPGGAISYVEIPNMNNNIEGVWAIMKHMYDTILYAEMNIKSDYCQVCGYDGEIQIVEGERGRLEWECPCCKNRDKTKMNVNRRTCGYIGQNFWNQGRTEEISKRELHVSNLAYEANEEIKEEL